MSWQSIATAKHDAINGSIPEVWRLPTVPSVREQRDVTGPFIRSHLTQRESQITETDAVGIVEKTSKGEWSAVEVTKAFCHRAALAQQLVSQIVRHLRIG